MNPTGSSLLDLVASLDFRELIRWMVCGRTVNKGTAPKVPEGLVEI